MIIGSRVSYRMNYSTLTLWVLPPWKLKLHIVRQQRKGPRGCIIETPPTDDDTRSRNGEGDGEVELWNFVPGEIPHCGVVGWIGRRRHRKHLSLQERRRAHVVRIVPAGELSAVFFFLPFSVLRNWLVDCDGYWFVWISRSGVGWGRCVLLAWCRSDLDRSGSDWGAGFWNESGRLVFFLFLFSWIWNVRWNLFLMFFCLLFAGYCWTLHCCEASSLEHCGTWKVEQVLISISLVNFTRIDLVLIFLFIIQWTFWLYKG